MFRILLLVGLIFASASQGFARKVDVLPAAGDPVQVIETHAGDLVAPPAAPDMPVIETKTTYCKSDCKGVISGISLVPPKASQAPDATTAMQRHSFVEPLEPEPPKS